MCVSDYFIWERKPQSLAIYDLPPPPTTPPIWVENTWILMSMILTSMIIVKVELEAHTKSWEPCYVSIMDFKLLAFQELFTLSIDYHHLPSQNE